MWIWCVCVPGDAEQPQANRRREGKDGREREGDKRKREQDTSQNEQRQWNRRDPDTCQHATGECISSSNLNMCIRMPVCSLYLVCMCVGFLTCRVCFSLCKMNVCGNGCMGRWNGCNWVYCSERAQWDMGAEKSRGFWGTEIMWPNSSEARSYERAARGFISVRVCSCKG